MKWIYVVIIVTLYMIVATYIDKIRLIHHGSEIEVIRGGAER